MNRQEAEDNIRRCGVEPTENLIDQFMWAYYRGKADSTVKPQIGFMCRTDLDTELYYEQDAMVCANMDMLIRKKKCTDECGIVKVAIVKVAIVELEIIEPGSLYNRTKT